MKDKRILLLTVVVLVLLVIAGYVAFTLFLKPAEKTAPTKDASTTVSGNLYDLTQKKGDQKCTWSTQDGAAKTTGTVYIAGGKFAMDMQTEAEGSGIAAHLIGDGKKVYMWTDFTDVPGVTMDYANLQTPKEGTAQNALIYEKTTYTCTPWTPEVTRFNLPSNITF